MHALRKELADRIVEAIDEAIDEAVLEIAEAHEIEEIKSLVAELRLVPRTIFRRSIIRRLDSYIEEHDELLQELLKDDSIIVTAGA